MEFRDARAVEILDEMTEGQLDDLPYGVVGMSEDGTVERYNATESRLAGLSPENVMGRSFFSEVAPCMNNFMVAQKLFDEPRVDETIPYVLTVRMRPTKVQLRMLKPADAKRMYVLIDRED